MKTKHKLDFNRSSYENHCKLRTLHKISARTASYKRRLKMYLRWYNEEKIELIKDRINVSYSWCKHDYLRGIFKEYPHSI